MINTLNSISEMLAYVLDKLKVKNPILFTAVQMVLAGLLVAFSLDKINIGDELDSQVIIVLTALVSTVSPRTSDKAKKFKDDNSVKLPKLNN